MGIMDWKEREERFIKARELRYIWRRKKVKELQEIFASYKVERGCYICGYNKCASVLHFHHRNPGEKVKAICRMIQAPTTLEKIQAEVAKCDIICANCHGELHANE